MPKRFQVDFQTIVIILFSLLFALAVLRSLLTGE